MLLRHVAKTLLNLNRLKCSPNVTFLLNTRTLIRSFSEIARNTRPIDAELSAHYCEPGFFKYFTTFLTENALRRHVSSDLWFQYGQALDEMEELHEIVHQSSSGVTSTADKDFSELAQSELEASTRNLVRLQDEMLSQAVVDDRDVSECTLEVRAGVGGKEACLFADELFRLYLKFIAFNGWEVRVERDSLEQVAIDENTSLWTSSVEIVGQTSYQMLRHEAGVHRVQRVPKTEKYGRIHTSTVSISVIPVRQNLVVVKESDLKFDVKNSSGAGGQNVNRNLTCVRCTHIPTGLAVESQETRFQYLNKDIAIRKMKALLNQLEYDRLEKAARTQKRLQIGIGARSDKIRTYNWPQNRITEHRLTGEGSNLYNIASYMAGEECNRMNATIERLEEARHLELVKQVRQALEQSFLKNTSASRRDK